MLSGGAEFSTAGLDLASQDNRTAIAEIRWGDGRAVLQAVQMGVDDDAIGEAAGRVALVGIDCPLGWPRPFVDLLIASRANAVPPDVARDDPAKQALAFRRTDVVARDVTGRWPLSVAADRIAYPAMRCAGCLRVGADEGRRRGGGSRRTPHPTRQRQRQSLRHRISALTHGRPAP